MAGLKVITPPAVEPVSLDDIKTQLQIDLSDEIYDDQIIPLIPAARDWCEKYQNRAYITQTLELALDCWPYCEIKLLRPPLQTVDMIEYGEGASVWDSTNYIVDNYAFIGRVVRQRGASWPTGTLPTVNGIRVKYVAGYGDDTESVPSTIKQAITLLCVHWFNNGLCDPPKAVYALLNLERVIPV